VNHRSPFQPQDLVDLDDLLLNRALSVCTTEAVHRGVTFRDVICVRHDVDNIIEPAVAFAEWEHDRGYRSTYFILHTAPYWDDKPLLVASLERIAEFGHEIGIHNNALAGALLTGRDPARILHEAVDELRGYGFPVTGTVAHGDRLCRDDSGQVRFVNDEMFEECRRNIGASDREIGNLKLRQWPLSEFGLEYDANWLDRSAYLSDSGGAWSDPGFDETAGGFPYGGQLHCLIHADWWIEAFAEQKAAA